NASKRLLCCPPHAVGHVSQTTKLTRSASEGAGGTSASLGALEIGPSPAPRRISLGSKGRSPEPGEPTESCCVPRITAEGFGPLAPIYSKSSRSLDRCEEGNDAQPDPARSSFDAARPHSLGGHIRSSRRVGLRADLSSGRTRSGSGRGGQSGCLDA